MKKSLSKHFFTNPFSRSEPTCHTIQSFPLFSPPGTVDIYIKKVPFFVSEFKRKVGQDCNVPFLSLWGTWWKYWTSQELLNVTRVTRCKKINERSSWIFRHFTFRCLFSNFSISISVVIHSFYIVRLTVW